MRILACILTLLAAFPAWCTENRPRAMFGVVTEELSHQPGGVLVRAVRPDSPALQAGVCAGDVLLSLNGKPVSSRNDVRSIIRTLAPGDSVAVELLRKGRSVALSIMLTERPARSRRAPASANDAVGGDRILRPLVVNQAIGKAMATHRREVVKQLVLLKQGFEPAKVTAHLQAIRHLARDANPHGQGWMHGEAGEVSLQFRDTEGTLLLYGANKLLKLTVYDSAGRETHSLPLNTPAERTAVPPDVMERLQRLR